MPHPYHLRNLAELADRALDVLESGVETDGFRILQGRVMAVQASPDLGSSEDMAWGVSALPAGLSVPLHSHRAEEIATIVRGSGSITIDGIEVPVAEGDILVTPPNLPHLTTAGPDGPLVVQWVYAPPGSEVRWLEGTMSEGDRT